MYTPQRQGSIEVICGPMFSGKTEELIRRVRRAQIGRLVVQVFKPEFDDRFERDHVVSHRRDRFEAIPVRDSEHLRQVLDPTAAVVAMDEIQFMDDGIVELFDDLANRGVRVIIAGLDQDSSGEPFGIMPTLMAKAEYVQKLQAICVVCGSAASRTQRLVQGGGQVLVGSEETYEPRCRHCHQRPSVRARALFEEEFAERKTRP